MVDKIQYRWDFIGLSTDTKPTPDTNDRVANGSTFYCSDNSTLFVWYKDQWYEKTVSGGGGGTSYVAGNGINISGNTISVDNTTVQEKLTAGSGITIADNIISAVGGGGGFTQLSQANYNWNYDTLTSENPNSLGLWLLEDGIYKLTSNDPANPNVFVSESMYGGAVGSISDIYLVQSATLTNGSFGNYIQKTVTLIRASLIVQYFYNYNESVYEAWDFTTQAQFSTLDQVYQTIDSQLGGLIVVQISQTDYDALTDKDPNTLYVINGA